MQIWGRFFLNNFTKSIIGVLLLISVDLIKDSEGFRETAYKCPAGKWTIGYGSTFYQDKTPVQEGDIITRDEADKLLHWYCDTQIKYPREDLDDDQKSALCSLIYNIGQRAFDKSKCKRAIVNSDWQEAYNQWDWVTAKGKVLPGLVIRREKEKKLFFKELL